MSEVEEVSLKTREFTRGENEEEYNQASSLNH
uniref:Uncharacterized protein n=1 Tax=Rhizophora mucronata TaxID=61149 RepID=A0A2P2JGG8_RHIMU